MSFEIKKDPSRWIIAGTGSGWELIPRVSNEIILALNDYIFKEKYGIQPDLLCVMDVLDEKPQIVSGLNNLGDVISRINALKIPLISPFKYEEIPLSEAFPLEECAKEFGLPYFSNTICYMIAYALLKGAKEVDLYGINQAGSHEYNLEKPGVEYWLGICNGRNVKITINGEKSNLLSNRPMYGGDMLYGYHQTYEQVIETQQKFGAPIVKRLLGPTKPYSRIVRKVNYV